MVSNVIIIIIVIILHVKGILCFQAGIILEQGMLYRACKSFSISSSTSSSNTTSSFISTSVNNYLANIKGQYVKSTLQLTNTKDEKIKHDYEETDSIQLARSGLRKTSLGTRSKSSN